MANNIIKANPQLQSILNLLCLKLKRYVHEFSATGATERSIQVIMMDEMHGRIMVADHMLNRLDGRKAGKIPYNFENIIQKWMVAKGISPQGAKPIDVARAIAWNIHWHGTKQQTKRSIEFFQIVEDWKDKDFVEWCRKMAIKLGKEAVQVEDID